MFVDYLRIEEIYPCVGPLPHRLCINVCSKGKFDKLTITILRFRPVDPRLMQVKLTII